MQNNIFIYIIFLPLAVLAQKSPYFVGNCTKKRKICIVYALIIYERWLISKKHENIKLLPEKKAMKIPGSLAGSYIL